MGDSPTWARFDFPILRAIADQAGRKPSDESLSEMTGIDLVHVQLSLERLYADNFIQGAVEPMLGGNDGVFTMARISLTGKGLRAVGEWPVEDSVEQFLEVLLAAIANEKDPVQRSRLERLKDSAQGVSVGTLSAVLAELAKRLI